MLKPASYGDNSIKKRNFWWHYWCCNCWVISNGLIISGDSSHV